MTKSERIVVFVLVAAYLVVVTRATAGGLLAVVGFVAFLVAWRVPFDRVWRDQRTLPVVVSMLALLAFAVPVGALPPPRAAGFGAAALGVLAFDCIWATRQYAEYPRTAQVGPRRLVADLRWGVQWGIALAIGLSLVVGGLAILVKLQDTRPAATGDMEHEIPIIVGAYFASGIVGGAIAGLMRPLTRGTIGLMSTGIVVAMIAYGVVGFAERFMATASVAPSSGAHEFIVALICGIAAGPPAALAMREVRRSKAQRL